MSMLVLKPSMCDKRNRRTWPILCIVWATFFIYGLIAAPVPGVNEPHYLCKAKHFWQPDWCQRDFFLTSPNAHTVFYATIGSLTNVFSFSQTAWIGRLAASLVLAWGWTRCFSCLLLTRWALLWSAWIFLACTACGNFSGEWIVGGVEGKVFSYGLLLAALGEVLRERWMLAATWAGLAVSIHPLVGIWGLFAFVASRVMRLISNTRRSGSSSTLVMSVRDSCIAAIPLTLIVLILGLPGLIPVVRLVTEPVSAELRYASTYIQVYFRLAHHLDPMRFPMRAYLGYVILLLVWLASLTWGGRTNPKRQFDRVILWAVVFAVAGIVIGYGPRPPNLMPYYSFRMQLLKFYPFRLADVLLPIAVAVSLTSVLERTILFVPDSLKRWSIISVPSSMMLLVFLFSLGRAHWMSESNRYSLEDRGDWLNVCAWIDQNLPADAVIQSPTNGWAFKWFARRAEYVAFKDCPQDAAGIVEWNRRLIFLQKWFEQKYADELYSAEELVELHRKTGITHLLTDRLGPLELEPIYRNGTFQVYDLSSLDH